MSRLTRQTMTYVPPGRLVNMRLGACVGCRVVIVTGKGRQTVPTGLLCSPGLCKCARANQAGVHAHTQSDPPPQANRRPVGAVPALPPDAQCEVPAAPQHDSVRCDCGAHVEVDLSVPALPISGLFSN